MRSLGDAGRRVQRVQCGSVGTHRGARRHVGERRVVGVGRRRRGARCHAVAPRCGGRCGGGVCRCHALNIQGRCTLCNRLLTLFDRMLYVVCMNTERELVRCISPYGHRATWWIRSTVSLSERNAADRPPCVSCSGAAQACAGGTRSVLVGHRPSLSDWLAAVPGLQRVGSEHHGPCPACGGEDRFRVLDDGAAFCRQCAPEGGDGFPALLNAAGLNGQQPMIRRLPLNSTAERAEWRYCDRAGAPLLEVVKYVDAKDGKRKTALRHRPEWHSALKPRKPAKYDGWAWCRPDVGGGLL